ncbi:MAG: MBL fold metallo-hydrolase [Chitinophagales bacterium]
MNKRYRYLSALIVFFTISTRLFAQTPEIQVKFIGNCGVHLTDGKNNLYVDFPYKSGAFNYMTYNPAELDSIADNAYFLFTHKHPDHYSKKMLNQIKSKHKGNVFGKWNINEFAKFNTTFTDFTIETFETKHHFSFKHYSYLITWHGKKIYFSGDTESAVTIANVEQIDWAFIPTWIWTDAKENNLQINANMFAIYHLYPDQSVTNSMPEKIKLLNKQGERWSL